MPSHGPHAPILAAGLADGCERCEEIARHPVACLDNENLVALWARMEYVEDHDGAYSSLTDAAAGNRLAEIRVAIGRLRQLGLLS